MGEGLQRATLAARRTQRVRRPSIILDGDDVRAVLAGTKTRHSILISPQPDGQPIRDPDDGLWYVDGGTWIRQPPHGGPAAIVYVRETWAIKATLGVEVVAIAHRADREDPVWKPALRPDGVPFIAGELSNHGWRSAAQMQPWMSRITLEVLAVSASRVQETTEHEAIADGTVLARIQHARSPSRGPILDGYANAWDRRYPKAPFASNPWRFVLTWRRLERGPTT